MTTPQEQLDALNEAIATRIAGGMVEEFTLHGVTVKYPTTEQLQKFRQQLMAEAARAGGTSVLFLQGDISG